MNAETEDINPDFEIGYSYLEYIDGIDIDGDVSYVEEMASNLEELINEAETPPPHQDNNGVNSPPEAQQPPNITQQVNRQGRELGNNNRKLIVQQLICLAKNGVLPNGTMTTKAIEWKVSRITIWRLWVEAKKSLALGQVIDVNCKKKGRVGRKPKVFNMEQLKAIPLVKRTTIRGLAHALGIGHSAVYRLMKSGKIRSHTNSIKPRLSPEQKLKRLEFILTQIIPPTVHSIPKFSLMYNIVHMDEKWFEGSRETQRFYLFQNDDEGEEEPYRCVQNKNYIGKVMFLAAVARPHIATDGEVLWDGKIGVFSLTENHVAIRSSINRPAGTVEVRAITKVTRDVIRKKLIEEVLPAIRAKWPANGVKDIWIQQDNARPHILTNDAAFNEAATQEGFNIRLICQPASSPDMNVLDLGFFSAIQSIQFKAFPKDVNELIKAVDDAYNSFDPVLLNYTWIQFHLCMLEALKLKGGNNYKSPHIGKARLDRLGILPQQIEVPPELIDSTKELLANGVIDLNVPLFEED